MTRHMVKKWGVLRHLRLSRKTRKTHVVDTRPMMLTLKMKDSSSPRYLVGSSTVSVTILADTNMSGCDAPKPRQ